MRHGPWAECAMTTERNSRSEVGGCLSLLTDVLRFFHVYRGPLYRDIEFGSVLRAEWNCFHIPSISKIIRAVRLTLPVYPSTAPVLSLTGRESRCPRSTGVAGNEGYLVFISLPEPLEHLLIQVPAGG